MTITKTLRRIMNMSNQLLNHKRFLIVNNYSVPQNKTNDSALITHYHFMPKRNSEPDFKKVKQKVGQKKVDPKATNVNVRMKRIRVQEQSIMREDQDMVNYRNKSLADLVGQFTHYNAGVRREAVLGLRDLFAQNEVLYTTSLNVLITKTIPLILDSDIGVRQAVVSIYGSMLDNVPKESLRPFSTIVSLFVNNGLTSINPAIRRSSLLMVQTLLEIEPSLFNDSALKLLSSMIKITNEVKASSVPSRGVLSSNRSQIKANSKEQRPVTELALETIQVFFIKCFSAHNIFMDINRWSGCQEDYEDTMKSLSNQQINIPLVLSVADSSPFLSSHDLSASENSMIDDSIQTLLGLLFSSISELVPQESTSSLSSHLRLEEEEEMKSKSISEKDLNKLSLLLELVANSLLMLEKEEITKLREKTENDWCLLLRDFYPLRLPDSHRNETVLRLQLQKVNSLIILLLSMFTKSSNKTCDLIFHDLQQGTVYITSNRKQAGEREFEILPETVVLKMTTMYRCWQYVEEKEDLLVIVENIWNELIEKQFAMMSLPLMQFYRYLMNQHQQIDFSSCLKYSIKTLQLCPYSADRNVVNQIWRTGLKLILGILKSFSTIGDAVRSEFERIVIPSEGDTSVYTQLSPELQSVVVAILSYCGSESDQIKKFIPDICDVYRFRE